MLRYFKQRNSCGPYIRCNGIRLASNSFWRHVVAGADECVGLTLGSEISRDTKIAQLDRAVTAEQDVGRLNVSVDNASGVEVSKATQNTLGNLSQYLFTGTTAQSLDLFVDAI